MITIIVVVISVMIVQIYYIYSKKDDCLNFISLLCYLYSEAYSELKLERL